MKPVHCVLVYLVLMAGVTPSYAWCWSDALLVGGAAVVGVVATPVVASAALGAAGFSAAGTATGSLGASLMSTYGGSKSSR